MQTKTYLQQQIDFGFIISFEPSQLVGSSLISARRLKDMLISRLNPTA